jgi:hypothetical protein
VVKAKVFIFKNGDSATRPELKQFSTLWRSLPKMVFRLAKVSKPEQIPSKN